LDELSINIKKKFIKEYKISDVYMWNSFRVVSNFFKFQFKFMPKLYEI